MSVEWDRDAIMQLIELYHQHEALWRPLKYVMTSAGFPVPDRKERDESLNLIATYFRTDSAEVERKLKNLTCNYWREWKKVEDAKSSGKEYRPAWFAYSALNFLPTNKKIMSDEKTHSTDQEAPKHQVAKLGPSKKKKKTEEKTEKSEDGKGELKKAVQLLKEVAETTAARDEAAIFGEYVASKIRKMSPQMSARVQHQIQNIIFEAESSEANPLPPEPTASSMVVMTHTTPRPLQIETVKLEPIDEDNYVVDIP